MLVVPAQGAAAGLADRIANGRTSEPADGP